MDTHGRQRLQEGEDNMPVACRDKRGREEGKERGEEGMERMGKRRKHGEGGER